MKVYRKPDKVLKIYIKETDQYYPLKIKGQIHREDGPAVEFETGGRRWYLFGNEINDYPCIFKGKDWVNIKKLNYSGPYKRYSKCFIELPIEVQEQKYIRLTNTMRLKLWWVNKLSFMIT